MTGADPAAAGRQRQRDMSRGRLMAVTVAPIAVILVAILAVNLVTNTERAIAFSKREMTGAVRTLSERFDGELRRVAQVAEQTGRAVTVLEKLSEKQIYDLLDNGVLQDPLIYGAAMAYVAGGFEGREAFCPYVYRDGIGPDSLGRLDIATAYDYLNDPEVRWWADPVKTGRPVWSEPYFDEGAGNIMMSTYSVPFQDSAGRLLGVTTVDIPLTPLQSFVGTDLDVLVLTSAGRYIHRTDGIPDGNPTIFEHAADRPDLLALAQRMVAGEAGMAYVDDMTGERQLVFFAPLPSAGWSFAVYLSEAQALADARREAWWLAGSMLLALGLIALAMWIVAGLVWRTQAELAQQRILLASTIDTIPDMIFLKDAEGRYLQCNPAFTEFMGRDREEIIGRTDYDLLDGGVAEEFRKHDQRVIDAGTRRTNEERVSYPDGSKRLLETTKVPYQDCAGKIGGVLGISRDITERYLAAEALAEAEERQRLVLDSAGDGIFGLDIEGRVSFCNRGAADMLGYETDELLGASMHQAVHYAHADGAVYDEDACPMRETFRDGVTRQIDGEVLWRKDGTAFPVEYTATPISNDGSLVGAVVVFRDITERKRSERELKDAKEAADAANQAKSAFLANMSHELRTPMNAILGYSEMLIEEAEDVGQDDFIPDLKKINQAGNHLLSLINDVLDLSKVESGKMEAFAEVFDVGCLIDQVAGTAQPLMAKNSNHFRIERGEHLGNACQDVTKLRQSLLNLLSNAAKFTHEGTISLRVTREQADGTEWLSFAVKDTGIGIAADKLDHVFKEFSQADNSTTRDYGGSGLGLTISRRFCQMLGGDMTLTSELGAGSTFTIRVPAVLPGSRVPQEESPPPDVEGVLASLGVDESRSGSTVLIIDDDPEARDIIERYLVKDGYTVVTAAGGEQGLRLAHEIQPAAITLDVMMPGMDGWSVLRALKADPMLRTIPVIMLSMIDDRMRGYSLGAVDYLSKPVDRELLHKALKRYYCAEDVCPVLLVEDDIETREMMARTLDNAGWAVYEAGNGQEALDVLAELQPRLILLDLMMPVMDGFEFLTAMRVRPEWRHIPVIVITAKDLSGDDRQRLTGRVEEVLEKNAYTREQLLQRVSEAVAACNISETGTNTTGDNGE